MFVIKHLMKLFTTTITAAIVSLLMVSCNNADSTKGASTPIDSSNVNGTAPATYSGNNPAKDTESTNRINRNDTGTKANNVHNTGYDSTLKR